MSNQSFKKDSPAVEEFLSRRQNPAEKFASLSEALAPALERPDGPITGSPVHLRPANLPAPIEKREEPNLPPSQEMQISVGDDGPSVNGRPRHGKKPKVEKTFAIPPEIHQQLVSISNHEGIRHDKKFSVSYIMGHLLEYALSHVEGTKVIPDEAGDGLVIQKKGEAQ